MNWRAQLAGWVLLGSAAGMCLGQTAPAQSKSSDATCIPGMKNANGEVCPSNGPEKKPSVKEQFPYPGSDSGDADKGSSGTAGEGAARDKDAVPNAPAASAGKQFPYPGDGSDGKAKGGDPEGASGGGDGSKTDSPDAGESSSNAGTGEDPNAPKLEDLGSTGKKTRRAPAEKLQTEEQREAEDLKVAKFYEDEGNWNAAYLRAKDAVKAQPDDSEAHFVLGQVALKMKKRDEARSEFEAYVKLDPDGVEMKKVKSALEGLK